MTSREDSIHPLPPCRPPFWAKSGHSQTLFGFLLPSARFPYLHQSTAHRVTLDGGDSLVVRVRPGVSSLAVSLFHGLTGSIESGYISRLATELSLQGHTIIAANHRGCGEGRGLARGIYHSGSDQDLGAVVGFAKSMYPDHLHIAVGFSLSGNALLLLAGREDLARPDAAIAVNPPIHLRDSSESIAVGLNRLYQLNFVNGARKAIRDRLEEGHRDVLPSLGILSTLREVDDEYTAPVGGFRDALDYYERCSAFDKLERITIPTWILTAADDPFIAPDSFRSARKSSNVRIHIESHGGHLGYLSQSRTFGYRRWLEDALLHFVSQANQELLIASQAGS